MINVGAPLLLVRVSVTPGPPDYERWMNLCYGFAASTENRVSAASSTGRAADS